MRCATKGALVTPVLVIAFAAVGCNRSEPQHATNTAASPPAASPSPSAEPRGDTAIATAVQAKFYADERLRGQGIDVSAEGATVTLRGTVPNDAAKQQAVNLARSVDGVTDVTDRMEVRETAASRTQPAEPPAPATTGTTGRSADAGQPLWITTKIQAQYFTDADVKPWNIDVTTSSGGVVTLEGNVDSPEAKNEAVRIARETEGVTRVEDRLRVEANARRTDAERTAGDATAIGQPDAWLTAKIQAKYFVDDEVKARNIDVDTRNGVVTLKGAVGSDAERRQAVAIARNTDGVRDVTDNLRVDATMAGRESTPADRGDATRDEAAASRDRAGAQPAPGASIERPDPWITMKIQSKYFLDADVKGHLIDVDTRDGVVTLKGRVENAQQKHEAEQIARETEGVTRVNNQLTVAAADAR
jgi:osmotically-inducible protein OsmY